MFRAFDPDRDRLVAIKLFRLDLPPERVHQLVAEFERLIATAVTHPSVIGPGATGIEGVSAYLAQDYVVGESLDVALRHGPSSVADALRVASQLAGALDAAAAVHVEHGVLHPRDVLLSADEVRLTGLGIARAVERVGVPRQVRRPYSAPERIAGAEWSRRADVFGLAALIHEMLWARRVSATGDEAAGSLTEIAGGDLPTLRAVFGRALANDPAERFDSALEFAGALEEAFVRTYDDGAETVPVTAFADASAFAEASADRRSLGGGRSAVEKGHTSHERLPMESEPRLQFEPGQAENAEDAVEKESEPVVMRADLDLRPPVLPPELPDSYRPAPEGIVPDERSRSAISPLAFALVIGAALGFAAGFGVGTWGRSTDSGDLASSDSRLALDPSNPSNTGAAATTGPAREFTEGKVEGEGRLKPDATTEDGGVGEDRGVRRQQDLQANTRKPAPAAPIVGSLLVRSTPPGARVLVDGREYGRTPLTVGNLSRGVHSVRVIRDGYVADERQVTITPAQRAHSVTARLSPERAAPVVSATKAAKPPGAAPLTVESRPAGARVFIDGRLVGTTPLVLPDVTAGEHSLYLDHDGYQRWSSAIRIVTTERNRVTASLDR